MSLSEDLFFAHGALGLVEDRLMSELDKIFGTEDCEERLCPMIGSQR